MEILEHDELGKMSHATAASLFHSVREPRMNVVKPSSVRQARAHLRADADGYAVSVSNGGRRFEIDTDTAFVLFSIREQVTQLRGSFQITTATGKGGTVTLRLPLVAAHARRD